MILQSMKKNGLILAAFAIATTGAVAIINEITKPHIADNEQKQIMTLLGQVLPNAKYDNQLYLDCTLSSDPRLGPNGPHLIYRATLNEQPSALIVRHITPKGYSGNIAVLTAVDANGHIYGSRVTAHKETPGLGDKVEPAKSDWILSLANTQVFSADDAHYKVKKDGGQFDQFTGATITPRAVVNSVNEAAWFAASEFDRLFASPNACQGDTL